jgi:ADP-ribose pyrophosphatase
MEIKKIDNPIELKEIVKNKYNPWDITKQDIKYLNPWATLCSYTFSNKKSYTILKQPNSVHVVAITKDNEIVLQARRFRPGVSDRPTLELVAGYIDGNDLPEETAIRELQEEIGANYSNIQLISPAIYKPDAVSSLAYGFVARIKDFNATNIDKEEQSEFDIVLMPIKIFVENITIFQENMPAPDALFAIQAYYQWILTNRI